LAVYALHSARYLAAIDTIAKRARYIAKLDGRNVSTASDVHRAMKESVVPADSKLHCALTGTPAGKLPKIKPAPAPVLPTNQEETILPPSRLQSPAPADLDHRRASEFIPT
jgi:hypothetical protein